MTTIEVGSTARSSGVNYLTDGVEYFQPAKVVLLAELHVRERAVAASLDIEGVSRTACRTTTVRSGATTSATTSGGASTALFPFNLNAWVRLAGAGHARSTIGRTTTSIMARSTSSAAAISGCIRIAVPIGAARHEHVRPERRTGDRVEGVHQGERRPIEQLAHPEDDAAVRGQLPRSRSRGEGSARLSSVPRSPPTTRRTSGGSRRSRRTRWSSGIARRARSRCSGAGWRCDGRVDARLRRHAHGRQPETNVVNRWGFSHEAPNLGVLGASVMGTSGAHNPTLTAQALAWRTAEHLAKNFNGIARRRS